MWTRKGKERAKNFLDKSGEKIFHMHGVETLSAVKMEHQTNM